MARIKKSRKPASAPTAKPKLSKVELANVEKRVRKKKGKKAGNRQQEAVLVKNTSQQSDKHKDPRIGNKTPIDLGGAAVSSTKKETKITNTKHEPIAAVRQVDKEIDQTSIQKLSPLQELEAIESDERLQIILAKQEDELALTEDEVDYFNELMERHQQLSEELAEDDEPENTTENNSEEDLWDKLDNSSISDDFEKFE